MLLSPPRPVRDLSQGRYCCRAQPKRDGYGSARDDRSGNSSFWSAIETLLIEWHTRVGMSGGALSPSELQLVEQLHKLTAQLIS